MHYQGARFVNLTRNLIIALSMASNDMPRFDFNHTYAFSYFVTRRTGYGDYAVIECEKSFRHLIIKEIGL
jgi:hypothetical protein